MFKYPNPLNLEIKSLKTFRGMEGSGYNASVYSNGKKVFDVIDDATGGELMIDAIGEAGKKAEAELKALCATLPKDESYGVAIDITVDIYLDDLINEYNLQKKLARCRAKATPFRLPGDSEDGYRTINTPDVAKAKAFLDKKFPGGYVLL